VRADGSAAMVDITDDGKVRPGPCNTLAELIRAAASHHGAELDAGSLADGLLAAIEGGLLLDRAKPTNPSAVAAVTHFARYLELTLRQGGDQP